MQVPWDWTVGDLKNKLMREYEGRPEAEEQKLIFSGKVLQNAQVLRDVVTVPAREEGDEEKENDEEFSAKFHLVVRSIMCAPSSSNRTSRANSEASTPRALVGSFEPEGSGLGERVSSPEAEATASPSASWQSAATAAPVSTPQAQGPAEAVPRVAPAGFTFAVPSPPAAHATPPSRDSEARQEGYATPTTPSTPPTAASASAASSPAFQAAYQAALRAVMTPPGAHGGHQPAATPPQAPVPHYPYPPGQYLYAHSPYMPYPVPVSPWGPFFPPPAPSAAGFAAHPAGFDAAAAMFANQANLMRSHHAHFAPAAAAAGAREGTGQGGGQGVGVGGNAAAPRARENGLGAAEGAANDGRRIPRNANANANANNMWNYINLQLTLKLFVLGIIINHDGSVGRLLLTGFIFMFVFMQQMGIFSNNGALLRKFSRWYASTFSRLDGSAPGAPPGNPVNPLVRLVVEIQWFFMALLASLLPSFSAESLTQQREAARPHQD